MDGIVSVVGLWRFLVNLVDRREKIKDRSVREWIVNVDFGFGGERERDLLEELEVWVGNWVCFFGFVKKEEGLVWRIWGF